jgi:4-hydroxy-tetrahydrodipicolinate reductase
MAELRALVVGAGGRMGQALVRAILDEPRLRLVGALDRTDAPGLGEDAAARAGRPACGVAVTADPLPLFANTDVVFDFTAPAATVAYSELSAQARVVHVIGTTGLGSEHDERLRAAARHARIVRSGNMSVGVNLLAGLVRRAAAVLGPDFDIEIVEMHHRHKVDAPSGTALLLGRAAAEGRAVDLETHSVRSRDGHTGPRPEGSIGFATLRGGSVVGEHTVMFAGEGEMIALTHRAEDRSIFARGAVRAALWAFDKKPGLYDMSDVLGLH